MKNFKLTVYLLAFGFIVYILASLVEDIVSGLIKDGFDYRSLIVLSLMILIYMKFKLDDGKPIAPVKVQRKFSLGPLDSIVDIFRKPKK